MFIGLVCFDPVKDVLDYAGQQTPALAVVVVVEVGQTTHD
jgi:hypothetical protein